MSQATIQSTSQIFVAAFENTSIGTALLALDGSWLEVNDALCRMVGYTRSELLHLTFQDITHPDDLEQDVLNARKLARGEIGHYAMRKRYLRKNGGVVWAQLTVTLAAGGDGEPGFFISQVQDISREVEHEQLRRHQDSKISLLVENVSDGFIGMDDQGIVTEWNRRAELMLQWSADDVIGKPMAAMLVPARLRSAHAAGLARYLATGVSSVMDKPIEVPFLRKDGVEIAVEMTIGAVRIGTRVHFATFMRDISARKQMEERLHFQATHDSLTALPNRLEFMSRLEAAIARGQRSLGQGSLVVMFIDLDGFKLINDSQGHQAGDEVLKNFAHLLRATIRKTDVAARLGGDEFVILLERIDNLRVDATAIAEKILEGAAALGGAGAGLSASIGIAIHDGAADGETLLSHSDAAMYRAKHSGKNCIMFHCDLPALAPARTPAPVSALEANEDIRLGALHATRLLDTPHEQAFDRLTGMACDVLRVPMAFISLVDRERQWFKSRCGLDASETARDISFCTHAIGADAPFIVPDARKDERFFDNPLVTGVPHIRFYAGIAIHAQDGARIGTLCIADTVPRQLAEQDLRFLQTLAGMADELIALRQLALSSTALLYEATQGSRNGTAHPLAHKLEQVLARDPLTGLPNRGQIERTIAANAARWRRDGDNAIVALLDIDNFNGINGRYGYETGDRIIVETVRRIEAALDDGDLVARLGGDLLLVLLHGAAGRDTAAALERLHGAVQFGAALSTGIVNVTGTLGFARFPANGEDANSLINCAQAALRRAKQRGHAQLEAYCDGPWQPDTLAPLEHELRLAAERGELVLLYQPKLDLRSRRITSAEALVRWRHPVRGLLGPGQFIPMAEQTGLIGPLTDWVIDSACRQLALWRAQGLTVTVAVNLSSRLLGEGDVVQTIGRCLNAYHVEARQLEIEITETGSMSDPVKCARLMERLQQLGTPLSVDDFGTGYSSLSYLKDFPFDAIKIDQTFVRDMFASEDALTVLQSMIGTGQRLKLKVVAEGVETAAQYAALAGQQVDQIQGYLLSPPVPAEHCERFFRMETVDLAAAALPAAS